MKSIVENIRFYLLTVIFTLSINMCANAGVYLPPNFAKQFSIFLTLHFI